MTTQAEERAPARTPDIDLSSVAVDGPLKDMAQAWAIARVLSQSSMVAGPLRGSPQNCFVTMMLGQELDLTWTQATRGIYVLPNGTPGLRGKLVLALIRKAGHRYTFERGSDYCKCIITRKDEDFKVPYEGVFTLADAKAADLVYEKDGKLLARSRDGKALPWEQYQRDMLQWRAVVRAADIGAPEVTYGFDVAGIGDGNEGAQPGAAAPGPAPTPQGVSQGPGQVYTAEVVQEKLADLNAQASSGEPLRETQKEQGPEQQEHPVPQVEQEQPQIPGYDDLEQLLKRCGFFNTAQAWLLSSLIHREVTGIGELSKAEVLIAHDVITKAIRDVKGSTGARREALTKVAEAERDAMEAAEEEHG